MLPRGSTAVSECFAAPAHGSVAYPRSRSSARSCVRSAPRAGGVSSCRIRPAPVAGSRTPPVAGRVCLASRAVLSASSPECSCAPHNSSPAAPPRHCGSPCPSPVLRSLAGAPSVCPGAANRPPVGSVRRPAHLPRITFHRVSSYRPGRRVAASRPRWHPCPGPPRVRPCGPDGCARLSSSRFARPRPPDSSTLGSRCASCASDPAALDPPASASRSQMPWPIPARTLHSSRRCPGARSSASPHSLPKSSRRCPSAALSAVRVLPTTPAPKRTPHDACRWRSSAGSARSSNGPGFAHPVQSVETVAAPANLPPATRSHARYRSPRNTPPAAPESKPQAGARAVLIAHDRSEHMIPPQTRRTRHPPVTRSTAYRKDGPVPLPTPCVRSRGLLASPRHSTCSSPCAHSTNYPCGSHPLLFHVPRLAPQAVSVTFHENWCPAPEAHFAFIGFLVLGREIPSFFILEIKLVLGNPS